MTFNHCALFELAHRFSFLAQQPPLTQKLCRPRPKSKFSCNEFKKYHLMLGVCLYENLH